MIQKNTQCAKDCGPHNRVCKYGRACKYERVHCFYMAQAICVLVSMSEESSEPIAYQQIMQKNYGIDIFDYEGHNL